MSEITATNANATDQAAATGQDAERGRSFVERFAVRVRRRETPFYDRTYRFAKAIKHLEMPAFRPLYRLLFYERMFRRSALYNVWRIIYQEPLFKSRCERVGRHFMLRDEGIPLVLGHLRLLIGDNCTISGVTTIAGSKQSDDPFLKIGDHTTIGYQTVILVGLNMTIGSHVMIANRCFIAGADNHHSSPGKHRSDPEPKSSLRSLIIEDDVFIATGATIAKGVTVGRSAIVSAGSVVTRNVPPYTIVAGNPARVIWRFPQPKS